MICAITGSGIPDNMQDDELILRGLGVRREQYKQALQHTRSLSVAARRLNCHAGGREFESRRPRQIFQAFAAYFHFNSSYILCD